MRLLVRTLGSPVPEEVQVEGEATLADLQAVIGSSDKLVEACGCSARLVHRSHVLRDSRSKLRELLRDGDVVVALAPREVTPRPAPPGHPPKGPTLREINATIREDLAASGPAMLAAAEATARREAAEQRQDGGAGGAAARGVRMDLLQQALLGGDLGALAAVVGQLQAGMQRPHGAEGGGADEPLMAVLDAFLAHLGHAGMEAAAGAGAGGRFEPRDAEEEGEDEEEEEEGESGSEEGEEGEGDSDDEGEEGNDHEGSTGHSSSEGEGHGELPPPQVPELDPQALAGLLEMGFSEPLCRNALLMGRNRFEPALEWLLANVDNPVAEQPLSDAQLARLYGRGPARRGPAVDQGHLAHLVDMGFDQQQGEQALRMFRNSLPAAASWLLTSGMAAATVPAAHPAAGAAAGAGGAEPGAQQQQQQGAEQEAVAGGAASGSGSGGSRVENCGSSSDDEAGSGGPPSMLSSGSSDSQSRIDSGSDSSSSSSSRAGSEWSAEGVEGGQRQAGGSANQPWQGGDASSSGDEAPRLQHWQRLGQEQRAGGGQQEGQRSPQWAPGPSRGSGSGEESPPALWQSEDELA